MNARAHVCTRKASVCVSSFSVFLALCCCSLSPFRLPFPPLSVSLMIPLLPAGTHRHPRPDKHRPQKPSFMSLEQVLRHCPPQPPTPTLSLAKRWGGAITRPSPPNSSSAITSAECELFPQSRRRLWFPDAALGFGRRLSPDSPRIPSPRNASHPVGSPKPGQEHPSAPCVLLGPYFERHPALRGHRLILGVAPKTDPGPMCSTGLPSPAARARPLAPGTFPGTDTTPCETQIPTSGNYLRGPACCFK